MIRHSPMILPLIVDGESSKLVAMTTGYGLHVLKVTDYNCLDEGDTPNWITACGEAWTVPQDEILWWAYASDVQELLEANPIS